MNNGRDSHYRRGSDGNGRDNDGYRRENDGNRRDNDGYRHDGSSQHTNQGGHQGNGGYQGGRDGDAGLSRQLNHMNVSGGGNRYSEPSQTNPRFARPVCNETNIGDLVGSAQYPRMPLAKKDLIYNTQKFAPRPDGWVHDKKAVGAKTTLYTNHVRVFLPEETMKLYCYNIEIFKNNRLVNKREEAAPLFHSLIRQYRREFPHPNNYVFNDVNIMWSIDQLGMAEGRIGDRRNFLIYKYANRFDFGQSIREDQDRQLLSTLVDAIATARVRSDFQGNRYTVFKRCMFLINEGGAPDEVIDSPLTVTLRDGLDARCGFSIGVRVNLRAGVTACYDINHALFSRPGYPLIRLLCEIINGDQITDQDFVEHWDARLRNAQVTSKNREEMDKILRKMKLRYSQDTAIVIDECGKEKKPSILAYDGAGREFVYYQLTDSSAERTTFPDNDGRNWTIAQFFLDVRNIRLRYPNLPCLVKKPSRQNPRFIAFPMEFVTYIAKATRFEGERSEELKIEMTQKTVYTAQQRRALLQHIIAQRSLAQVPPVVDNNDYLMRRHKLKFADKMLEVKASILPTPTVVYGEGSKFKDVNHIGEWEAITHEPIRKVLEESVYVRNKDPNAPKIKKRLIGSVLNIGSPVNETMTMDYDVVHYHRLIRAVEDCGQPVAWENKEYRTAAIQGVHNYLQGDNDPYSIVKFFQKLKDNIDDKYKESDDEVLIPFVLVVFQVRFTLLKSHRDQYTNDYNLIKFLADSEMGIFTQGILQSNLCQVQEHPIECRLTRLIVEKILAKVGTTHRKLEREGEHKSWTKFTDPKSPTLVLGVDVSHPSPKDREQDDIRKLSVATVVGNIDFDCNEFRASSRIQDSGEEKIVQFREEIQARINDFIQNTGVRPAHIVVYRDGLCEGDFQRILYEERIAIENCCIDMDLAYQPTITYIVVTKRHHTRFFLQNDADGHESQGFNVLPGTLVEDTVTTNEYYDFFLTTQVGQKGVAHPTHYYVLWDTWKPMVSFWPTVTHALTYSFCRTTSTVSLPAPVLYAHLAAKRSKECLDGAWLVSFWRNETLSVNSYSDVNKLTGYINFNKELDGMTFV